MPDSNFMPDNSLPVIETFNKRYPAYVVVNPEDGSASDITEAARSVATAISRATASNNSYVFVPAEYTPYRASLISSALTTSNVYLIVEGG